MTAGAVSRAVADSFAGVPVDLGASTNYIIEPTRYINYLSPTNDHVVDFSTSTNTFPQGATYSLWIISTNATTFSTNNTALLNSMTTTGTNLYLGSRKPGTTKWQITAGKAY
jgi:hypothetical protein